MANTIGWVRQADGSYVYAAEQVVAAVAAASAATETTETTTSPEKCSVDSFQGVRFYDGASYGFLRVHPDKVELLVDEPLEYEGTEDDPFDGSKPHTYRITGQGKDVKLYIDGVLAIDGTGKFTRSTSQKIIEMGDISGRKQGVGSTWDGFRYSVDGAQSPSEDTDRILQDVASLPMGSIGRMKSYRDGLYMSYDPADPLESSTLFRYEEGGEIEKRPVLAVTKSNVTCVLADPNRQGSAFGSTGKLVGTDRGLQYVFGSKADPFDVLTKNNLPPQEQGWQLETNCESSCSSIFGDALNIDTRRESSSKFHKYVQRRRTDPWITKASNSVGWTVEARVKVVDDGSVNVQLQPRTPRDFVLLCYFGETMTPDKAEMAKRAMNLILMNMGVNDRLNVVSFASYGSPWASSLTVATKQDLASAKDFVNGLYAQSGANVTGAFTTALGQDFEQDGRVVIFLTDGSSDEVPSDVPPIITAANSAGPNAGIFCLGIGSNVFNEDVDRKKMLVDIAAQNGGTSRFAPTENDLDNAVLALWKDATPGYSFDGTGPSGGTVTRIDMTNGEGAYDAKEYGVEPQDDLNAPCILVNDGVYQEYVQFFNGGVRLKYANVFAPLSLSQKYYTIRVVGRDRNIAVYAKADGDQMFRRVLFADNALYVRSSVAGEQEQVSVATDLTGFTHAVWQDSEGGSWRILYSKTIPSSDDVKCSGTGVFSSSSPNLVSSSSATFVSSKVEEGDLVVVFGNKDSFMPDRIRVKAVLNDNNLLLDSPMTTVPGVTSGTFSFLVFTGRTEWTAPIVVSTQEMDSTRPRVVVHSSGDAFCAYENDEAGYKDIYVRRISFSPFYGVPQEVARLTNTRYDSAAPALAEGDDGLYVAWSDSRNDRTKAEIFACRVNPTTMSVDVQGTSLTSGSTMARNPRIVAHPAIPGEAASMLVAYDDLIDSTTQVRTLRLTEASMSVSAKQVISSSISGNNSLPSVATNGRVALVAWQNDGLGTSNICAAWLPYMSTTFSAEERVTRSRGEAKNCDVLVDPSGAGHVVFEDDRQRTGYPFVYYAKYSNVDGEWLSSAGTGMEAKVDTYMTTSARPAMCMDSQGVITVAYEAAKDEVTSRVASCLLYSSAMKPTRYASSQDDFALTGVNSDNYVSGYFPLDDNSESVVVENKVRRKTAIPPPLNVVMIIDTSSSMSATALSAAKSAATKIVGLLGDSDKFDVMTSQFLASKGDVVKLFGTLSPATTVNKASALAFISSPSGSTTATSSGSVLDALQYTFDQVSAQMVLVFSQGESTDSQGAAMDRPAVDSYSVRVDGANVMPATIICHSYQPVNSYLLEQVASSPDGLIEVLNDASIPSGEETLVGAVTQAQLLKAAYVMAPPENGESSVFTNTFRIDPPDDNVSSFSPGTQGAFDLSSDGNAFSIPASLVGPTGAIEFWMRPHWDSTDVGTMVIFGNDALGTITPNTMSFGATAITGGNALRFRVVDASGYVHQTEVQNTTTHNFSWAAEDLVHVRATWDNRAIGSSSINDVSFADASTGFACGAGGSIFKTTDGGATWSRMASGTTYDLYAVDFVDASTGMAVGEMGTILKTTDGGATWIETNGEVDNDINGVYVRTSLVAFAVGSSGIILRTADGGSTWDEITTGAVGDLRDVAVLRSSSEQAVVVIGAGGQIYRSTDDGLHFLPIAAVSIPPGAPASTEYTSISRTHQAGNYKSYVVGRSGMILSSSDAGLSWTATVLTLSVNPSLYGVSHAPASDNVYAVGQDGMLLRSSDGGSTWVMYGTEVKNGTLRAIDANLGGTGSGLDFVAAGVGGSVVKSADGGALQTYSITRSGNLTIYINGKEPVQVRTGDVPFDWLPSLDVFFGDYQFGGTDTANAVLDELYVYKGTTPAPGSVMRRKPSSVIQPDVSGVIHRIDLEKRIEWGHVNSIAASSYWTDVRLSLCSSFEPLQVFSWTTQLGIADDVIRDMCIDENNRLWMATENGIGTADLNDLNDDIERWLSGRYQVRNKKGRFVNLTNLGSGLPVDAISSICVDENNDVWAGTDSNGLLYLIRRTYSSSFTGTETDQVDLAKEESGIVGMDDYSLNTLTVADGLASNSILTVRRITGGIAVGTNNGLSIVSVKRPLTEDNIATIAAAASTTTDPAKETEAAIVTEGNPLEEGAASTVTTETPSVESQVETLASSRITTVTSYGLLDGLPSEKIQAVGQDEDGTLWVGTDKGLVKFSMKASTTFTSADGLANDDIYSIFFGPSGDRYVGTGYGMSVISGATFSTYLSSSGIGTGLIRGGTVDAHGVKWLATSVGLVEMREDCDPMFRRYSVEDGLLGDKNIVDFKRYRILGNPIPWGGCEKILVMAMVNGENVFGTYSIDASVPFVIFDQPLAAADKVEAYLYHGWREVRNFSSDQGAFEDRACVKTTRSTMPLYRRRFPTGEVVLGGNLADGANNAGALMYGLFVVPASGSSNPIESVSSPTGAVVIEGASAGDAMYSDDTTDLIVLPANEVRPSFHVALPSAGQPDYSDDYLRMTLSSDAWLYVAYDSRATQLPFWMRDFEPLPSTYRIVDLETYEGNGDQKLYVGLAGTNGCMYDVLHDPSICDLSGTIAMDDTGPVGCAKISRVNSVTNVTLSLTATDDVSGVSDMQVSAKEDFTDGDGDDLPWVPFSPSYNLELPADTGVSELVGEIEPVPPGGLDQQATRFFSIGGKILITTKNPGRVYSLNPATGTVTLLFETSEDEVTSLATFAGKTLVGTASDGRVYTWDGTSLTLLFEFPGEDVRSMATFDSTLFIGTSPNGRIYSVDEALNLSLFKDTYEESVNGFAVLGSSLFWATSNGGVSEGMTIRTTTARDHAHSIIVPIGTTALSGVTGTTSESDGHVHAVTGGVVAEADGHTHVLNGSKPGRVFKYDPISGQVVIVHADKDYAVTSISTVPEKGLLFASTYPNGKIYRFVAGEDLFIKSFDTTSNLVSSLRADGGQMYASASDDVYFFDGRRWQFMTSTGSGANDVSFIPGSVLILHDNSISTIDAAVNGSSNPTARTICAYVRFRDGVGNISTVKNDDGTWMECYNPCVGLTIPDGGGGGGDGSTVILSHRLVEIDPDAKEKFSLGGDTAFLSGNKVEEEVAVYESEVFNGTSSLVQWVGISWEGSTPSGTSITMSCRSASTSAGVLSAEWSPEMEAPSGNDITNQTGQFLQFRATLKASQPGVLSPELHLVHIEMRTAQAVHYFTTHFRLPNDLRRGILTYNGCLNPPSTDIVFGISGDDTTDFAEYAIITPNKVFEVPPEHQKPGLRVGIKLVSSPQSVPVVDEFALLFSLANDAIVRLNLPGSPGSSGPELPTGTTRTVVTERVQDHAHTVTFDALITDKFLISGRTSTNASHAHDVVNGEVQPAAGHVHTFDI